MGLKVVNVYRALPAPAVFPTFATHLSAVPPRVLCADQAWDLGSGSCCADGAETASEPGPPCCQRSTAKGGESGEAGGRHSRASGIVCTESA